MSDNFRNLLYVLRRYKVATVANILGLTLAFIAFMFVTMHVRYEYGFDKGIPGGEYIFQVENLRDDGIWESNWSRPQIERFVASSPYIEAAAVMNGLSDLSFVFGFSTSSTPGSPVYMTKVERIRPGFIDVFSLDIMAGSRDNLQGFGTALIPESLAKVFFGDEDPVGRQLFPNEFKDIPRGEASEGGDYFTIAGLRMGFDNVVGGVFRDFPENSRLKNVVYTLIPENEMMDEWYTGPYYCYVKLSSPDMAGEIASQYVEENREILKTNFGIVDIRLRPLTELYFGPTVRGDSSPSGNRAATDMLMLIGVLIILIGFINYVNFSVALAPVRIKSVNTRKVLGCPLPTLRNGLVFESLAISFISFLIALAAVIILQRSSLLDETFGHSLDLGGNTAVMLIAAVIALAGGCIAGLYPAWYMTSFPPAMAINGSYSLTGRAKATRKILIGFQYVISIALITGSIFVALQNRYVRNAELGFDKDKIMEVRLGLGTALTKNPLYRELTIRHPDIEDVAFIEQKFGTDESQTLIGYNYRNEHYFMGWMGVSHNFLDVMGIGLVAGRNFRLDDAERDDDKAVAVINETAAREIISRFPGELNDISELVGTHIQEHGQLVEIIGITRDFHNQSLYRQITPHGLWVSSKNYHRRHMPENFSYVKIGTGDPSAAIEHIRQVIDEIDPGYPADIRFFDQTIERMYGKARREGRMITFFSMLAIIISLVGVFGLVIFEAQRREKEIAVRKVFGAGITQILLMFNSGFMKIVAVCFIIAVPLAWYAVSKWLENFAYKTPMYAWVFIVALAAISLLTVATVTFQSYRTATENPARKLHR